MLLDISLEELNNSGMIAEYVAEMNHKNRTFQEDGVGKRWKPYQRWEAYLAESETFAFAEADIKLLEVYGFDKHDRSITKEGVITHEKRQYQVTDTQLFSRQQSTKVKISVLSDGTLALFSMNKDGELIGKASAHQAPSVQQTAKVDSRKKAQVEKIVNEAEVKPIMKCLQEAGFIISSAENGNYHYIHQLTRLGLTLELTQEILGRNKDRYESKKAQFRLGIFASDAQSLLKTPKKIIHYAGELA